MANRFPSQVPAINVLGVEARLAQLDRGLAADVEAVRAVHDDRLGLRQFAAPLLELLGIAPLNAFRGFLLARDVQPRPDVDDLDWLAGGHHVFYFLHADALDVAELRLFESPRRRNLRRIFVAQLQRLPI